jgi:fatty acid desaturase/rubredoxin
METKIDWVRVPVEPELLKELNQTSNWLGLKQAGGHILLTALSGALVFWVWRNLPFYWVFPVLALHGNIQSMLGSGVHELIHERVFKTRWLNHVAIAICSFLTFWNHRFFFFSHKEHHRFTLYPPMDLEVTLPGNVGFNFWQTLFNYRALLDTFKDHARIAMDGPNKKGIGWAYGSGEWEAHVLSRLTPSQRASIRNWSKIMVAGHGGIALVSIATGFWMIPVIVTLSPFFCAVLGMLTGAPQHFGLVDKVNDFRLSCRTYRTNRFFEFLYWNMNFHIEHHMFAAVPCYHLPRLHESIKPSLPPIHQNLVMVWSEILFTQHMRSQNPAYQYLQPLPGQIPSFESKTVAVTPAAPAPAPAPASAAIASPSAHFETGDYKVWECNVCGFLYDEAKGHPEDGIAPGTRWEDVPEDWVCPNCAVSKEQFQMVERARVQPNQDLAAE